MEPIRLQDDLVYDIGMHKGEDSAYYLAKGFRVVAFEANPDLVNLCRHRFRAEIQTGQLTVVEGAVSSSPGSTVEFFEHPLSVWGTTLQSWASRNEVVATSRVIQVPIVDLSECLRQSGMPHYMKIDVEGADVHCLETLLLFCVRPVYVSIESSKTSRAALEQELRLLEQLGYDRFAAVQQANIPGTSVFTSTRSGKPLKYEFEPHSSGPFGADIIDWVGADTIRRNYRRIFLAYWLVGDASLARRTSLGRRFMRRLERYTSHPTPGWFDTHAARSDEGRERPD